MPFFERKTLLSTLYEAKRSDPVCVAFGNTVKMNIREMELNEVSTKDWTIPTDVPAELVLQQVKKQNFYRLKFSLHQKDGKKTLRVYDPRPCENYKYGYDRSQYPKLVPTL